MFSQEWPFFMPKIHQKGGDPTMPENPLFSITQQDVINILARRTDVSQLSPEDIALACQEVKSAIEHHLDIREYINIGLDSWEIVRNL